MVRNRSTTYEGDVTYTGVGGEVIRCVRPARHELDESRRVAACHKGAVRNRDKVARRPCCSFGGFQDEGIAGEDRGYNGVEEVVEGVAGAMLACHVRRSVLLQGS